MLRLFTINDFAPVTGLSGFCGTNDQTEREAVTIAKNIANQVYETRTAVFTSADTKGMTDPQIAALAEITITELAYLQTLGELGCFLASSYSDDENQKNAAASGEDTNSESDEEKDDAPVRRTASTTIRQPPPIGNLAANLLIASGKIRQEILDVCQKLSIQTPFLAATLSEKMSHEQRRQHYTVLVNTIFTRFGGGHSSIEVRMPIDGIFEQISRISESVWNLLTLCSMTNAFRFIGEHSCFKTMVINPNDSIFGNNGWRIMTPAATCQLTGTFESAEPTSA